MASGIFALPDDAAMLLDDAALMSKVVGAELPVPMHFNKTAGPSFR